MKKKINKNQILSGKNIYLRNLNITDINNTYLEMINDPINNQYLESQKTHTLESLKLYYNKIKNSKDSKFFAIIEKKSKIHIGNAKIGPIDNFHKRTSFGRLIHKNYHNKGYGSEVTLILIKYIFEILKLEKIIEFNIAENIGSYKSNIKAGLLEEGKLKKYVYNRKKHRDVYVMGLTKDQYLKKKLNK